ncbi:beta strand repeat-containing protein [Neorhizobium petrolearium]|uniref:beta strand repeat-containing protein n=1 Tax=Neorhizobium petrolearium TaxID=515361 RepID=UPI003F15A925
MTFKLTLATTTAVGLLIGTALAGNENEAYIDQIGSGNSASIVQGQSNGSAVGNRAGYTTQRIRQDGTNNELIINQTHNSSVNSPPRNQINRAGAPGDQAGLGIDQIGNANYLRIDQTGANQAVFEVQQNGGTSATTSSNNATITQNGGWSARVSNLRQTFTGGAADGSNDVTINQTGQSSRVGNTSSGPRNDGSGAHQTGFGNQLTINQTGNSQLVYTATQTNSASSGGTNVASVTQGGGNGNQIRELNQVNTGAADNTATLTFSGNGNGAVSGVLTGPALGVGVLQSRIRQTGEGNDLSYVATGDDNLFGFVQDGLGNWIVGTVDGSVNQVAVSQEGDVNSAELEILGDSNQFGIAQIGEGNEALVSANGNANELALSQIGIANLGEIRIGYRIPGSGDNVVVLNQDSLASFGNVGEIYVDGNANTVSLDQLGVIGSNYGTVEILGDENGVAVDQEGSNEGQVFVTGNLNVVSLDQNSLAPFGNEAGILVDGNGNTVSVDQLGATGSNEAAVDIQGDANDVAVDQNGSNQGDVFVIGAGNAATLDQEGAINSALIEMYGDGNDFDVDQNGTFNDAVAQANGNANEVTLSQTGDVNTGFIMIGSSTPGSSDDNVVVLSQDSSASFGNVGEIYVGGNANTISVDQLGVIGGDYGNNVLVDISGDENDVTVDQVGRNEGAVSVTGNLNAVTALQLGSVGVNSLAATIDGSSNVLNVSQTNSGAFGAALNSITVDIHGNSNNSAAAFSTGWSSAAVAGGLLAPGDLVQLGTGNSIALQVGSALSPNSNDNQFAFAQHGDGNMIDGSIMGIGNEVAIVQAGNSNYASFSQIGNSNSIGVSQ